MEGREFKMNVFENVVEKIGKAIAYPFIHAAQVIEVLTTALHDEPAVKTAVVGLIQQIEMLDKDGASALAAKGINIPEDMATLADAKALWQYVTDTFLPAVEAAYKDFDADLQTANAAPAADATPVADAAMAGPGLHTVTAA
jgi:hypothetical protein